MKTVHFLWFNGIALKAYGKVRSPFQNFLYGRHTPPETCSNLKVNFQSKTLYIPKVHTCRVLFIAKLKKVIDSFSEKSQMTVHNNVKY